MIRNVFLTLFVFFALTPCAVNKVLFTVVESEYSQPLNKSRTTLPANSCEFSQNEFRQSSAAKKSEIKKRIKPVDFPVTKKFSARILMRQKGYSKAFSGNSPPKYILYKRLKIDLV